MQQSIIRCTDIEKDLAQLLQTLSYDSLFLLTDDNTLKNCLPLIQSLPEIQTAKKFSIPAGEESKSIESLSKIWKFLSDNGATRKSLLINLGGGMLTDLGGFAASTFKRGIRFVNIPTTLLGAVDAAVGGKTGINFNGLKNEVGVIHLPEYVLVSTQFFKTLDEMQILNGSAEMIKTALIADENLWNKMLKNPPVGGQTGFNQTFIEKCIFVKEDIVKQDPTEKGIRKALNLGHTIGHAFESLSHEMNHPVLHGYAVAWGLVCELYLSFKKTGFPQEKLTKTIYFIKENYGVFSFDCNLYERLYELMQHDKKNDSLEVNFTLLSDIGNIKINQTATKEEIFEALDFYREYFGI